MYRRAPFLCGYLSSDGYAVPCVRPASVGRVHRYAGGRVDILRRCAEHAGDVRAESGGWIGPQGPDLQAGEVDGYAPSPDDCERVAAESMRVPRTFAGPWYVVVDRVPVLGPFGTGDVAQGYVGDVRILAEQSGRGYARVVATRFADGFALSAGDVVRAEKVRAAVEGLRATLRARRRPARSAKVRS